MQYVMEPIRDTYGHKWKITMDTLIGDSIPFVFLAESIFDWQFTIYGLIRDNGKNILNSVSNPDRILLQ